MSQTSILPAFEDSQAPAGPPAVPLLHSHGADHRDSDDGAGLLWLRWLCLALIVFWTVVVVVTVRP
jgi:hypothetical protein